MILLTPGPANTSERVRNALTAPDICPREQDFGSLMWRVRDRLTAVVAEGDDFTSVLLGGSGTAAVEAALVSAVPTDGQLLILDNGAYGARMAAIAQANGLTHEVFKVGDRVFPSVEGFSELLRTGAFSHVALVHHETSTGMLNPVAELSARAHEHGATVIVDAISSYAGIPIDISGLGADLLVASSNKCIQGMPGISFVVCRSSLAEKLGGIPGRSLYLDLGAQHRFFEKEKQTRFTPPVQCFYALEAALDEYFEEGGSQRHRRYVENWRVLNSGMLELGFRNSIPVEVMSRLVTEYEPASESLSFEKLHDRLYERGYTIYPGKTADATFRVCNIGAIGVSQIHGFLEALRHSLEH